MIFGVQHFHKYLIGRRFTLVTDHKPLVRILGSKQGIPTLAAARLQRWGLILSAYEYDLEYIKGEENKEADLSSRLPLKVHVVDPNQKVYRLEYCDSNLPVSAAEVAKETQADPVLRKAYQLTLQGWRGRVDPSLQPYARRANELMDVCCGEQEWSFHPSYVQEFWKSYMKTIWGQDE